MPRAHVYPINQREMWQTGSFRGACRRARRLAHFYAQGVPESFREPTVQEQKLLLATPRFRDVEMMQATREGAPARPRQIVLHDGSVLILPLVDEQQICLIRNYRVAVGKTLIELPAGTIEHGDPPLATAQRELKEETGYTAAAWREVPGYFMSPGILRERNHVFVASDLSAGRPAREAGEEIENLIVDVQEALAMTLDGRIEDAKTICALLMWDRLRG